LELVIKQGIQVNVDNEHEMELVDDLLKTTCQGSGSTFGLRLNPAVGGGLLAITSTATRASKFGLPITPETRNKVMELYVKYKWLSAVHIHVGSQGIPLQTFADGIRVSVAISCSFTLSLVSSVCRFVWILSLI
jgi:diaminopimelate decarboxylase